VKPATFAVIRFELGGLRASGRSPLPRGRLQTMTRILLALLVVLVVGCAPAAPPVVVTRYIYVQAPTPQPEAYAPTPAPSLAAPPRTVASAPPGVWTEPQAAQGAPVAPGQPYAESTDPRWTTHRIAAPQYEEPPLPVVDAPFAAPPTVYVQEGYPYAYAPAYYGPTYYGGPYYSRPFVGVGIGMGAGFRGGFRGGYGGGFHGGGGFGGRGGFGRGGGRR
jgi:hypothetical protein